MMAAMGKAQDLGPDFPDDGQQDVEVTGTLPMSMTTFVGRDQELGEIRSLFREGKRLVTLVGIGGILAKIERAKAKTTALTHH
jgi:hypothetical protein